MYYSKSFIQKGYFWSLEILSFFSSLILYKLVAWLFMSLFIFLIRKCIKSIVNKVWVSKITLWGSVNVRSGDFMERWLSCWSPRKHLFCFVFLLAFLKHKTKVKGNGRGSELILCPGNKLKLIVPPEVWTHDVYLIIFNIKV